MNELRNQTIRSAITDQLDDRTYTSWNTIRRNNPQYSIGALRDVMRELLTEKIVEKQMEGSRAGFRLAAVQ